MTVVIGAQIEDNPVQPGFLMFFVFEHFLRLDEPEKRFLDNVLCLAAVAVMQSQPVHAIRMTPDNRLNVFIAEPGGLRMNHESVSFPVLLLFRVQSPQFTAD